MGWPQLDRLAEARLHQETVDSDQLVEILGSRPAAGLEGQVARLVDQVKAKV